MQVNGSLIQSVQFSDGKTIPYTVKESGRARRVSLKFTAFDGLIVVVPHSYDIERIPAIIDRKKEWIARVAGQFQEQIESVVAESIFPESITLHATGKTVVLKYVPSSRPFAVRDLGEEFILSGRYDAERVRAYLQQWVRGQARQFLAPLLLSLAREQRISVSGVNIRLQRGRWGSCSVRCVINLNARLMFLPEPMARYVCMHELAHCIHHNHSKSFWEHLERIMPGAANLDRTLRDAWKYVPRWAYS